MPVVVLEATALTSVLRRDEARPLPPRKPPLSQGIKFFRVRLDETAGLLATLSIVLCK